MVFLLFSVSCRGNREPPISAGDGLALSGTELNRTLAVDPARVPLITDCPAGKAVFRTTTGWSCGDLAVVDPREIERLRTQAQQAADTIGPVAQTAEDLRGRVSALEHSPPYGMAAIACSATGHGLLSPMLNIWSSFAPASLEL